MRHSAEKCPRKRITRYLGDRDLACVAAPGIGERAGPFRVGDGPAERGCDLGLEQFQAVGELGPVQVSLVAADRYEPVAERLVIAAYLVDDLLRAAHQRRPSRQVVRV